MVKGPSLHHRQRIPFVKLAQSFLTTPDLGPLHTRDWEPMTITLQALSLVIKVEPVQVCFKLRLRDQLSMWMQHGCKILHVFLHDIKWIMIQGHVDYFQKPPLGGRLNIELGDHGTLNAHNCCYFLFIICEDPAWLEIHWNNIWLRPGHTWLHTTREDTWPHYMILEVCWDGLWTLSFGLSTTWSRLLGRVWSDPKGLTSSSLPNSM
jgi:hypothetical protein